MDGSFNVPWFMFDIGNNQLITTNTIPSTDISDTKDIVLTEIPIPGLNFNPITSGGNGNRKISFTLPLIKRNNTVGNVAVVKQFENLRNQESGIFSSNLQFSANPKVLYYWGTSNPVPLEYFVSKCEFSHRSSFVNRFGFTQFTDINFELILDESSILFQAEETFRKIASLTSSIENIFGVGSENQGGF